MVDCCWRDTGPGAAHQSLFPGCRASICAAGCIRSLASAVSAETRTAARRVWGRPRATGRLRVVLAQSHLDRHLVGRGKRCRGDALHRREIAHLHSTCELEWWYHVRACLARVVWRLELLEATQTSLRFLRTRHGV